MIIWAVAHLVSPLQVSHHMAGKVPCVSKCITRVLWAIGTTRMYIYIQRGICFKELALVNVETSKPKIGRAGQQAGAPGKH